MTMVISVTHIGEIDLTLYGDVTYVHETSYSKVYFSADTFSRICFVLLNLFKTLFYK